MEHREIIKNAIAKLTELIGDYEIKQGLYYLEKVGEDERAEGHNDLCYECAKDIVERLNKGDLDALKEIESCDFNNSTEFEGEWGWQDESSPEREDVEICDRCSEPLDTAIIGAQQDYEHYFNEGEEAFCLTLANPRDCSILKLILEETKHKQEALELSLRILRLADYYKVKVFKKAIEKGAGYVVTSEKVQTDQEFNKDCRITPAMLEEIGFQTNKNIASKSTKELTTLAFKHSEEDSYLILRTPRHDELHFKMKSANEIKRFEEQFQGYNFIDKCLCPVSDQTGETLEYTCNCCGKPAQKKAIVGWRSFVHEPEAHSYIAVKEQNGSISSYKWKYDFYAANVKEGMSWKPL